MRRILRGTAYVFYLLAAFVGLKAGQVIFQTGSGDMPDWFVAVVLTIEVVLVIAFIGSGIALHALARIFEDVQRLKMRLDIHGDRPL